MKRVLYSLSIVLFLHTQAQDAAPSDTTYWKKGGTSSLTFSQVSLSNWAAGGQNSSSINAFFNVFADKKLRRHKWNNALQLGYGLQKQGEGRAQKSDDRIAFQSSYGYQVTEGNTRWFLSGFIDFRTQFVEGFSQDDQDSVISRFMAPAYLTVGTGIEYSPNEFINFSYKPLTGKLTFVLDGEIVGDAGAYGVAPGRTVRGELGSYFSFQYKQEAIKNVNVETRLELFTNYEAETFGNIDVNWQNTIVMQINKYMTTNLFTQLLYDDDINTERVLGDGSVVAAGPKVQFKSVFGFGITYNFGDQRVKE